MADVYTTDETAVQQQSVEQPTDDLAFQPMPEQEAAEIVIDDAKVSEGETEKTSGAYLPEEEEDCDYSIEKLIEEIIATHNEDEDEDFTFEQQLPEENKEGQAAHEQHRFPNVFTWIPDGWSKYVIILVLIFFIWLVSPIAFIIGLIALYLWFKCDGDSCSIC